MSENARVSFACLCLAVIYSLISMAGFSIYGFALGSSVVAAYQIWRDKP